MSRKQLEMIQWIRFYESIGDLDDFQRPSEAIIDDDEACDKWKAGFEQKQRQEMLKYYEQREGRKMSMPARASRTVGRK